MVNKEISAYMAKIGRSGGRKSKRALASTNAKQMVRHVLGTVSILPNDQDIPELYY